MAARPTVVMVAGCVLAGVIAVAVLGPGWVREVGFGMLGPLLAAVASWELIERTYRRDPVKVTGRMVAAFGVKVVFFGVYVAVMLRGLALHGVGFVVSFTAYFIGLHAAEAFYLRRLFTDGTTGSR
jgi:hypothetical protein